MNHLPIVVGISGASGAIYGVRLIKALIETQVEVMVILSDGGKGVLFHEMRMDPEQPFSDVLLASGVGPDALDRVTVLSQHQMASETASGSFLHSGMVVCPCSMKSLSAIAAGYADNLLTRSADVCLKERRPLVVVPRETPFNLIHLENMAAITRAGGVILPPSPSFYSFPATLEALVDTVVARILDHLKIEHDLIPRWGS